MRRGDFYKSSFQHPILGDRERTIDMTPQEYSNTIANINFEELFFEHTNRDYFIPLLNFLRKKHV